MDIKIPDKYSKTIDGRQFLLLDIELNEKRILVFSTHENMKLLTKSKYWFVNGLFQPLLFIQIYTIQVLKNNTVLLVIFALVTDKTQNSYERLFSGIKTLHNNVNPKTIMTDFEQSSINAFIMHFPNAKQNGCFFLSNTMCIYLNLFITGMSEKYKTNSELSLQVRFLTALAFVPKNDVIDTFKKLCESSYYIDNKDIWNHLSLILKTHGSVVQIEEKEDNLVFLYHYGIINQQLNMVCLEQIIPSNTLKKFIEAICYTKRTMFK